MSPLVLHKNESLVGKEGYVPKKLNLPEGTVCISPLSGVKMYFSKKRNGFLFKENYVPPMSGTSSSPNNKGERSMSSKKWVWAGVIVAVVTVVIWLYRKFVAGEPENGK